MGRQRKRPTEITRKLEAFEDLRKPLEPSPNIDLSDDERAIFDEMALARHVSEWIPSEVILLSQAAQIAGQMNELAVAIRLLGSTEIGPAGRRVQSAESVALTNLDKTFMIKIRALKMTTAVDARALRQGGQTMSNVRRTSEALANDEDNDLLAMAPIEPSGKTKH